MCSKFNVAWNCVIYALIVFQHNLWSHLSQAGPHHSYRWAPSFFKINSSSQQSSPRSPFSLWGDSSTKQNKENWSMNQPPQIPTPPPSPPPLWKSSPFGSLGWNFNLITLSFTRFNFTGKSVSRNLTTKSHSLEWTSILIHWNIWDTLKVSDTLSMFGTPCVL